MNLVDLRQLPDQAWQESVLQNYRFPPLWWMRQVDSQSRCRLMSCDLTETFAQPDACLVGAFDDDGVMIGFAEMKPMDWDTNHFGFSVFKLGHVGTWGAGIQKALVAQELGKAIADLARERGARTVHGRVPLDDICLVQSLEEAGFRLMEVQVICTFNLNMQAIPEDQSGYTAREFQPEDETAVIELARHAYTATPDRFHSDPHLPPGSADNLYAEWMKNSCSGKTADYISVVEVEKQVKAYGTLRYWDDQEGKCNLRIGQFLIGAVAPEVKERGLIGTTMIAMLHWLKKQGADMGFVGTQANNIGSLNSMIKLGFRPVYAAAGMHLWLDN